MRCSICAVYTGKNNTDWKPDIENTHTRREDFTSGVGKEERQSFTCSFGKLISKLGSLATPDRTMGGGGY